LWKIVGLAVLVEVAVSVSTYRWHQMRRHQSTDQTLCPAGLSKSCPKDPTMSLMAHCRHLFVRHLLPARLIHRDLCCPALYGWIQDARAGRTVLARLLDYPMAKARAKQFGMSPSRSNQEFLHRLRPGRRSSVGCAGVVRKRRLGSSWCGHCWTSPAKLVPASGCMWVAA